MRKRFSIFLAFMVIAAPHTFAADMVDWGPCKEDIKKFRCQSSETNYQTYRCLTKHDTQLSKECYAVTVDYERTAGGE